MKKSGFTDSQIIGAFKRAEAGLTVPELCRELGSVRRRSTSGGPSSVAWIPRSWGNSPIESFWGRLKTACIHGRPRASQAGHHELDGLLQLPQIAFELGLSQSHAIRTTLVRGTAQKGRVIWVLRTPQNRGNITLPVVRSEDLLKKLRVYGFWDSGPFTAKPCLTRSNQYSSQFTSTR